MERGGFEPPTPVFTGVAVFKAAAFNHSATSPGGGQSMQASGRPVKGLAHRVDRGPPLLSVDLELSFSLGRCRQIAKFVLHPVATLLASSSEKAS